LVDPTSPEVGRGSATNGVPDGGAPEVGDPAASGPQLARAVLEAALARRRPGRARRPAAAGLAPEHGADADPVAPGDSVGPTDQTVTGAGPASSGTTGVGTGKRSGGRGRGRGYSGAGPDPRDPQPFGLILDRLIRARGWQRPTAEATVFGCWTTVVGAEVAVHCRPIKLERGELLVEAESTAWATQLRLLVPRLLVRIGTEVGPNVVTKLTVQGPTAPAWSRGSRRVTGRGPRDTYG
jgi:predicted nucleic acid-binding Zn ribbon protein